jgi:transposase
MDLRERVVISVLTGGMSARAAEKLVSAVVERTGDGEVFAG